MNIARALTIAGSDCSGGAGIQADLKTFQAFGVYGASVITAIVSENTVEVSGVHPVEPAVVSEQIDACLSDTGADAVKTGMLVSAEIVRTVSIKLKEYGVKHLVVDPVLEASTGGILLGDDCLETLIHEVLSLAEVVTPNRREAEKLVGFSIRTDTELRDASAAIGEMGPDLVIITGGDDSEGGGLAIDWAWDGKSLVILDSPRIPGISPHGTGCAFSAAITALLARGLKPAEAAREAKDYIYEAIRSAPTIGHGRGPVNHAAVLKTGDVL